MGFILLIAGLVFLLTGHLFIGLALIVVGALVGWGVPGGRYPLR